MNVSMRRADYTPSNQCDHAGLFLDRGFNQWNDNGHGDAVADFHQQASRIGVSSIYQKAYEKWKRQCAEDSPGCQAFVGKLEGRLFLGLGNPSPIEAGITLHHTYGAPCIPGSAIKGTLHHYAQYIEVEPEVEDVLFGREPNANVKGDTGEAGYLVFNDAWWVPETRALVPEIVTPHHTEYYSTKGETPVSDFDRLNPNPQIAIVGSFLFSIVGDPDWATYAMELLQNSLHFRGVGAKSSSGYGLFDLVETEKTPEQKIELLVSSLTKKNLLSLLGSKLNNTGRDIGEDNWRLFIQLVNERFASEVADWESFQSTDKKLQTRHRSAFKVIMGAKAPNWD